MGRDGGTGVCKAVPVKKGHEQSEKKPFEKLSWPCNNLKWFEWPKSAVFDY